MSCCKVNQDETTVTIVASIPMDFFFQSIQWTNKTWMLNCMCLMYLFPQAELYVEVQTSIQAKMEADTEARTARNDLASLLKAKEWYQEQLQAAHDVRAKLQRELTLLQVWCHSGKWHGRGWLEGLTHLPSIKMSCLCRRLPLNLEVLAWNSEFFFSLTEPERHNMCSCLAIFWQVWLYILFSLVPQSWWCQISQ